MIMQFKRVLISGEAIVVAFDMCSSSDMLEELILRANLPSFQEFLTRLKEHLAKAQEAVLFDPYKFTGDGWILLFPGNTDGAALLQFLRNLSAFYQTESEKHLLPRLSTRPRINGITFGLEKGPIAKMTIFQQTEYVGRAIAVACRLQSAVKGTTRNPAYKALVSTSVFDDYLGNTGNLGATTRSISLHNIRNGRAFRCKRINLLSHQTARHA
jgi:hypothetical protein